MGQPRTALITGIAGQDGVLLTRHLLRQGYAVVGTRQPGIPYTLEPYLAGATVVEHDLVDTAGFIELFGAHEPDEVYNLAGFSSVARSWDVPELVQEVNGAAVERMLDVLSGTDTRFFQASSAEMFGPDAPNPQDEDTPHCPDNPYAESKTRASEAAAAARSEGFFACVGILYNHESPLRDLHFVTRKITRAAAEIGAGLRDEVELGNLDVARDWGAAREYVEAMHAALTHDEPGDYIIATGRTHTLRDLVEAAFAAAGVADGWGHVRQDPDLLRQSEIAARFGDASRARTVLGWEAQVPFEELVREMVEIDQRRLATGIEESPDYLS
ncbi:MAG: GDP-mannose 4,6-dehydratase [Aeromicrobium sp.]